MPVLTLVSPTAVPPGPQPREGEHVVYIADIGWSAEVADTAELRSQGLSGRERLSERAGMLFVFPSGRTATFWMGGMRFPLDFVWISGDCTVSEITKNALPLTTSTQSTQVKIYQSAEPTAFTFEINAGESDLHGIEPGDRVRFEGFSAGC